MNNWYRLDPGKLMDITMPLGDETPCYPGDTPFKREVRRQEGFVSSRLSMSSHSGTHMDPPAHLAGGGATVDMLPPERLILPAVVVDGRGSASLGPGMLEGLSISGKAVLFRTGAPRGLTPGMPGLEPEAARVLVREGAVMAGTDAISMDPPGSAESHQILLPASVPILENLLLDGIEAGDYLLLCFPLRLEHGDGSPVRAFLQVMGT